MQTSVGVNMMVSDGLNFGCWTIDLRGPFCWSVLVVLVNALIGLER